MKLKTLEQFGQKDPCECGGNCGCGGKPVNEKFSFSKKEVEAAATLIASAISQADKVKAKVHDLEYDKGRGAGFEISIDGEKYEGGSYVVKDNGDVVNAAIGNSHPNAVYNTIGNKDIADVFINMEKYESNTVTEASLSGIEFGNDDDIHPTKFKPLTISLKKNKVKMEVEKEEGDHGYPEVKLTGKRKDIEKVLVDVWGPDSVSDYEDAFESVVTEAKKYKFKDLAKAWQHVYGEDMEDEYQGFYQEVVGKYKNKVTKADIATIWSHVYGEEIADDYDGFYNDLKENLEQVAKLEELDNLVEANTDGTISDDEDERREDLLGDVEMQIDELIQYGKDKAYEIGGTFRGPGIWSDVYKLIESKLKKAKR